MDKNYITKLFDLTGETAVVTGGLGQLGSEYVKTLALAGAKVAVLDIAKKENSKIKDLIKNKYQVVFFQSDITRKKEVQDVFKKIKAKLGTPTILVNNAGLDSPPGASAKENGPYEDYPEESWDAVIDSHLKGMFMVSQEFLRLIRPTKKNGSIINISSTYGVVSPDQSLYDFRRRKGEDFYKPVAYSVAKSGVLNFTRWLAEYCRQAKISVRVNTLVLGGVFNNQPEEFLREYNKRTILNRMARPDEYNAAILFLASAHASSYMTGSTLVVDGGWTAR